MAYTGLVEKYDFVRQTRNSKIIGDMQYYPHTYGLDGDGQFKPIPVDDDSKTVANTEYVKDNVEVINANLNSVDESCVHKSREETIIGIKHVDADFEFKANHTVYVNSPVQATQNITAPIFNGDLNGTSLKAKWADLAEVYETDKEYPVGTLVGFGGEKEVTEAGSRIEANFVISSKPAYLMNSEGHGQPCALFGRVPVRVFGKVKKFENLNPSLHHPGCATAETWNITRTGMKIKALEAKETDGEGLIMCFVQVGLGR